MHKYLLFFLLLLSQYSYSQNNNLLWKISGSDLEEPSYIFGTIHLMDSRIFNFDSAFWKCFMETETITGELNMDSVKLVRQEMMKSFMLPAGKSLQDYYEKEEDYQKVKDWMKGKLGAMSSMATKMKPVVVSGLIIQSTADDSMPSPSDEYLQYLARSVGKDVAGLETINEQLSVLNSITIEEQASLLLEQVEKEEEYGDAMELMVDAYLDQDLDKILDLMQTFGMNGETKEKLLAQRNELITERMISRIKKESTFNTMGAAHLPGEDGVIRLLRDRGYNVTPVVFQFKNTPFSPAKLEKELQEQQ